jgi:hypothetical protein
MTSLGVIPLSRFRRLTGNQAAPGKLFRAKRLHDVDAGGACCREHRSNDRRAYQHKRRNDHRQRTRHFQVAKIAGCHTRSDKSKHRARQNANASHHNAFRDNSSEQIFRLRPKRQADAEFTGTRADRKRENAGDANNGNQQRDRCEDTKDQRVQTVWSKHRCTDVFESGSVLNGYIGGHLADDFRYGRYEGIRICGGVDQEMTGEDWRVCKGGINGG